MRNNIAFDSIDEIAINIRPTPVVDPTRKTTVILSPSTQKNRTKIKVGNYVCSGVNQKIVGNFWNSKQREMLVDIPVNKRPGLDMAIKAVGLTGKVKATQNGGLVNLIKL